MIDTDPVNTTGWLLLVAFTLWEDWSNLTVMVGTGAADAKGRQTSAAIERTSNVRIDRILALGGLISFGTFGLHNILIVRVNPLPDGARG